jgi:hypothetical protein
MNLLGAKTLKKSYSGRAAIETRFGREPNTAECYGSVKMIRFSYSNEDTKDEEKRNRVSGREVKYV